MRAKMFCCIVFGVVVLLNGVINVVAQEPTIDEMLFGIDAVSVTASRFEEKTAESPATIIVITDQQIKERGYQDLKDVLLDLPAFDITPNIGGESGGWQVLQRGIYGNNKLYTRGLRQCKK